MSYEMSFEMYVGAKEQRKEVLEVIKKALTENGFEKFANNFIANKRDGYKIEENTCCSFSPNNFDEAISTIYKSIIKELPEVVFEGYSRYTWGTYEEVLCFEKENDLLMIEKLGYEGTGCCDECGVEVVFIDDYDPTKIYTCPECGEIIPNEELYYQFEKENITYKIVKGELIKIK